MAIAVDQLTIGSAAIDSAATTIPFTTSQPVAAGGFITLDVGAFYIAAGASILSVADNHVGGSLTWTIDKQVNSAVPGGGFWVVGKISAQAPAGLASGTTITATYSATTTGGRSIAGTSFTGVKTSSPVDGTPPAAATTTTTAWATTSMSISSGSLLSGMAYETSSNFTSTPTSPSIEEYDINGGAGSFSMTGAYRIELSAGSYTVAGTWSGAANGIQLAVAYLAAPSVDNTTKPALAGMFSPQLRQDGWF